MKLRYRMLDPRRLQLLVALQRLGTVRAVAAEGSLTPSAVSQQLAVLQAECGVELLARHGRSVRLTAAGEALADEAVGVLDRLRAAEDALGAWREGARGVVRVGALTSAMAAFVIPAARALRAEHPGLELELSEIEPHLVVGAVRRAAVDLALVASYGAEVERAEELDVAVLLREELLLVAPAGAPAADPTPVALADLRGARWLLDGSDLERHLVACCRAAGFEPRRAGRLPGHDTLLRAVAAGLGVTVLPRLVLDDVPEGVAVRRLRPPMHRTLHLLSRRAAEGRRSVALVREAIGARIDPVP